jgi:NAD(P)-dependent dehydrogenase (short-subunit alcohol dehydrogenase family)
LSKLLEGRVALVTGGGQGVGQGIVRALAEAGADIVIAQRNAEQGEQECAFLRDTHGVEALFVRTDVTKADEVAAMIEATTGRFGRLDILVNNAGASFPKRFENHSDMDMAGSFELNFWAVFRAMRAGFPDNEGAELWPGDQPRLAQRGECPHVHGRLQCQQGSRARADPHRRSRMGQLRHHLQRHLPVRHQPAGEYFAANPKMTQQILDQVPAHRFGDSEQDIGPIAVFLASEGSSYFTGNTLFVDGGGHVNGVAWRPQVED